MSEQKPTEPKFNHVLDDIIRSLSFGQVYELERGLFLSEFDRKQLCDYLLDELDRRRKMPKTEDEA